MGAIWLDGRTPGYPPIDQVIGNAGLALQTWEGWQHRSRSSGGYDKLLGIVAHHTASPTSSSFQNDWSYCVVGNPDNPVASILLGREGQVGLHAAGAANHAGKSEGPWVASKGTVPTSAGNSNLIGIEASNNGVGEPWAPVMLDAYERLVAALCSAYGFDPTRDVPSHAVVGPGWTNRKIDPWGPAGGGNFPYTGSRTWVMQGPGSFTEAVQRRMSGGPAPLPEDDDMPKPYLVQVVPAGTVYVCSGDYVTYRWITDGASLDRIRADMKAKGLDDTLHAIQPDQLADQGVLVGPAVGGAAAAGRKT